MPNLSATPELVMLTWLRSLDIPFLPDVSVEVPDPDSWTSRLYIGITSLGGSVDRAVPIMDPLFRVSFYGKPDSGKINPPWNVVNVLAQDVWKITYTDAAIGTLTLPGSFNPVFLPGVQPLNLPSRVTGDPRNLARFDLDLAIPFIEEI